MMPSRPLFSSRPSLRSSIIVGLLLVITLVSIGFIYAVRAAFDQLEFELLDQRLMAELAEFKEAYQYDPTIPLVSWGGLQRYRLRANSDDEVPAHLQALASGMPAQVTIDGREHLASTATLGDTRLFVALDVAAVPAIEANLMGRMGGFLLLGYALALLLGWIAVSRVSKPLAVLANQVAQADPIRSRITPPSGAAPREVAEIGDAFQLFMLRMRQFIERERAFTDDAGHELRTPLAVIASTVELMRQQANMAPSTREHLNRISRATLQMSSLVESFLLLAREEGSAATPPEDAARLIHETLDNIRQARPQDASRLHAVAVEPWQVRAPPAVLMALVGNLVLNALSHTEGHVRIVLKQGLLSVHDDGQGIDPKSLDQIFDRRARSAHSDGYGLGLFLVKRICTHVGWTLRARSRLGVGSSFEVDFGPP
jgi:signal transduction histidine kinase